MINKMHNSTIITCNVDEIRLNKFLADNNICSRREADTLITNQKVKVNLARKNNDIYVYPELGLKLQQGDKVMIKSDEIEHVYYIININNKSSVNSKTSTTAKDNKTISLDDLIQKYKLSPLANLDQESSGLVLYTNDTQLLKSVLNSNRLEYEYIVKIKERAEDNMLKKLKTDLAYEGKKFKGAKSVRVIDINSTTLNLVLREYQSHIVKRMLNVIKLNTISVRRVRLGNLKASDYIENIPTLLSQDIVNSFKKLL